MNKIITIIQTIISILLISFILLQAKAGGLGSAFGGSAVYSSKRGAEKFVFYLTIILAIIFFITSILNFIY